MNDFGGMDSGMGTGFTIFGVMFILVFLFIFGVIITTIVIGIKRWHKNNNSPVLTVNAKIVTKRQHIRSTHSSGANNSMGSTSTHADYYATFEVESGDRMELEVPDDEYGLMVEGDSGKLTFQGTRFLSFKREF